MMMAKTTLTFPIFEFMDTSFGALVSVLVILGGLSLIGLLSYFEEKYGGD